MSEDIKQTNSGVAKKGDWKEVAEFAEEVEDTVSDTVQKKSAEEFRRWRPRNDEGEEDMKRKTVEIASLKESNIEKKSNGVKGDLRDASENVMKAGKKAANRQAPSEEITEASESFARPFISEVLKSFRRFESFVYSKFALRSERYYLDTEDFSVDLKTTRDGMYRMDVNVNSESSRQRLKEKFENG